MVIGGNSIAIEESFTRGEWQQGEYLLQVPLREKNMLQFRTRPSPFRPRCHIFRLIKLLNPISKYGCVGLKSPILKTLDFSVTRAHLRNMLQAVPW
jgi:hypothetical protein